MAEMSKIRNFVAQWQGHGYEKGETHAFWLTFLRDVLDISEPEKIIQFEVPVKLKHTSFIDAFLPDTKVIIEQKSSSENLEQEKSQSDGSMLTPYGQAQRYGSSLPYSMRPRWIVVSNFKEFLIYDMETLIEPTKILLEELPEKFSAFDFMIDETKTKIRFELELSLKAGEIVGKLYDALKKNYINPNSEESLQSLNKLCVRLVFCLYAESSGIFGKRKIFRDYLSDSRNIRRDLLDLFEILNTPKEKRDPYLADELKIFPYVNGGLFADEKIEIPNFTPEIKNLLLNEASSSFNWSGISPTIFGAVFESTLNPVTRRAGGMHYTSIENIHKVIEPLFLDELHEEFFQIKISPRNKKKKLLDFQNKLSQLKFFDPACGSGNFLTESFISLRRLENELLKELLGEKILLGAFDDPIKVSIQQFYGIEINDFACTVAQTALWIAELQMRSETAEIIHKNLDFLPLKSYANIFEGNALRMNWKKILPNDINFIFGNPPNNLPKMTKGSQPTDGGHLILSPAERNELLKKYPQAEKFIKPFIGAEEFLNGKIRYCLWLVNANPSELKKIPPIVERLKLVSEFRLNSATASVRRDAQTPTLFTQIRQPTTNFLVFPRVSSERRKYIPIGFFDPDIIVSDAVQMIANADLYMFGVLTSGAHNAWTRVVCGRLESRIRYSPAIYNNFIWCQPSETQRKKIELTAQNILDIRKKYPDTSLADLYDPLLMPKDLRDAHKKNDSAVLDAYAFDNNLTESQIVAELMNLYQNFIEK